MIVTRSKARGEHHITLIIDAMPYFASFLNPRELYNFVYSSKVLCENLAVLTVVDVGMHNGNSRVRRTLELLYEQTCFGKIYPPTAMRLLRLINLKRCEVCCSNTIHHVRDTWGLALCWPCVQSLVTSVEIKPPQYRQNLLEYDDMIRHPRVLARYAGTKSKNGYGFDSVPNYHVFSHRILSQSSDPVGPIITAVDLITLSSQGRQPSDIDSYINTVIRAPPLSSYDIFNSSVRSMRFESRQVVLARQSKRLQHVREKRRLEAIRAIEVVDTVMASEQLSTAAQNCLLNYGVTLDQYVCTGVGFPLTFQTEFANRFLSPVLYRHLTRLVEDAEYVDYENLANELSHACTQYQRG